MEFDIDHVPTTEAWIGGLAAIVDDLRAGKDATGNFDECCSTSNTKITLEEVSMS